MKPPRKRRPQPRLSVSRPSRKPRRRKLPKRRQLLLLRRRPRPEERRRLSVRRRKLLLKPLGTTGTSCLTSTRLRTWLNSIKPWAWYPPSHATAAATSWPKLNATMTSLWTSFRRSMTSMTLLSTERTSHTPLLLITGSPVVLLLLFVRVIYLKKSHIPNCKYFIF